MLQKSVSVEILLSKMPLRVCSVPSMDYARTLVRHYLKRLPEIMADQTPLVRQWILLRTLCARHYGATVKEMAAEMEVSEKTIRRDLETFQTAGFPIREKVEEFGRKKWHVDADPSRPGLSFTFDERRRPRRRVRPERLRGDQTLDSELRPARRGIGACRTSGRDL